MTERLSERERTIETIRYFMSKGTAETIADWHLSEVKRIIEPIKQYKYFNDAIDETLKRAGGE